METFPDTAASEAAVAGGVPLWEVLVSVVLLVAATVGLILLAARVYGRGVLQVRGRLSLRQALRSA